jgi:hypothetical protein
MVNIMHAVEKKGNNYVLNQCLQMLPVTWRSAADTCVTIMLLGPGETFDGISPLVKKYASEVYLAVLFINTSLLEQCLTSSSVLAFATPIFLVIQVCSLTLLYARTLIELAIAVNEPILIKEEQKTINLARWHSSGSQYYEKALSNLRRPWHTFHSNISLILFPSLLAIPFISANLAVTLSRLAWAAPIATYFLFKLGQSIVAQQRLRDLQVWVEAAPTEEKSSRRVAQKEILRYLQEEFIDPNPFIEPLVDLNFLGVRLAFKKIPFYHINFKQLHLTSLPEQLWSLTTLRTLNLEGNHLTELSEKVADLPYLETLNVKYNQLQTLPAQLATGYNLSKLQTKGNPGFTLPAQLSRHPTITHDTSRCLVQ